jgi:hypothetical protein
LQPIHPTFPEHAVDLVQVVAAVIRLVAKIGSVNVLMLDDGRGNAIERRQDSVHIIRYQMRSKSRISPNHYAIAHVKLPMLAVSNIALRIIVIIGLLVRSVPHSRWADRAQA